MKKHGWVFTLNNYSQEELPLDYPDMPVGVPFQGGKVPVWDHDCLLFIGYGKEKAGTGTPHLQGMVVFNKPVGLRTLKKLNPRAHFAPMLGSFEEARRYCSKENFTEWREPGTFISTIEGLVEQDHLRAKVIAQEETTIVELKQQLDVMSGILAGLCDTLAARTLLTDDFEKKIQETLEKKLSTGLYKDKFL